MDAPRLEVARPEDAAAVLRVRDAAIRGTAAPVYGDDLAAEWASRHGPGADRELSGRIAAGDEVMVVARVGGAIVAFGSFEPATNELRALYAAPANGRRGIASLVLRDLEARARGLGVPEFHLDASLNAESFYRRHGYAALGACDLPLPSGRTMTCVRMRKLL